MFYDLKKERLEKAQNTERFQRAHSQQPAKNGAAAPANRMPRNDGDNDEDDDDQSADDAVGHNEDSSDESDGEVMEWSGIPLFEAASACEKYTSHRVRLQASVWRVKLRAVCLR